MQAASALQQRRLNRSHRQLKAILCFQASTFAAQDHVITKQAKNNFLLFLKRERVCSFSVWCVDMFDCVVCREMVRVPCGWSKVMVSF